MKIFEYFEKAWVVAAAVALLVAVYNGITLRTFDNRVYFPLFCVGFCILIWRNLRGQRLFKEKMIDEQERKQNRGEAK